LIRKLIFRARSLSDAQHIANNFNKSPRHGLNQTPYSGLDAESEYFRRKAALGARVFARDSRSSCAQTVSGIEAQREIADMSDPVFDEQLLAQRAIEIASLAERVVEEDFGVFLVMLLGDPNRAALTNVIAALRPQEDPKEVLMGYTRKLLELRASDGVLTEPWRSMLSTFGVTATEETVPAPVAG